MNVSQTFHEKNLLRFYNFRLQTWSSILDLRPQTIFISFGSVAKAHLMPAQYKKSLVEVVKRFPTVTFIWKYEVNEPISLQYKPLLQKPDHNISAGIANLIESTWVPQRDLLRESFVTWKKYFTLTSKKCPAPFLIRLFQMTLVYLLSSLTADREVQQKL